MCDHALPAFSVKKRADLKPTPVHPDHCHIYYVHQDGTIFCESNVDFTKTQLQEDQLSSNEKPKGFIDETICGDDRLTLIHLPGARMAKLNIPDGEDPWPDLDPIPTMPDYFAEKLSKICPHCSCKAEILWRNFHRPDPHFDVCFRYKGEDKHRCFLKFYSLTGPYHVGRTESPQTVVLSIVLHIRAELDQFVSMPHTNSKNKEHMIGFVAGFTSSDIGSLLTDYFMRWQDIPGDHLGSAGMTPKLFLAAGLSQYGSFVGHGIMRAAKNLVGCDKRLEDNLRKLGSMPAAGDASAQDCATLESCDYITTEIHTVNMNLINMNRKLTGTRSTMHYLADSADLLVKRVSAFETSVQARLEDWTLNKENHTALMSEFRKLDCFKESIRDADKLELVKKSMFQYKVDIKALQQHIDITVAMVRNLISERDRKLAEKDRRLEEQDRKLEAHDRQLEADDRIIQLVIARNTSKDGFSMKVLALLGSFFLPATFMANFFAAPIFNWDDKNSHFIRTLPFGLYWGVTGLMTVLLIVILRFVNHPEWITAVMDFVPLKRVNAYLQNTKFYIKCKARSADQKEGALQRERTKSFHIEKERKKSIGASIMQSIRPLGTGTRSHHPRSSSFLSLRGTRTAPADLEKVSSVSQGDSG